MNKKTIEKLKLLKQIKFPSEKEIVEITKMPTNLISHFGFYISKNEENQFVLKELKCKEYRNYLDNYLKIIKILRFSLKHKKIILVFEIDQHIENFITELVKVFNKAYFLRKTKFSEIDFKSLLKFTKFYKKIDYDFTFHSKTIIISYELNKELAKEIINHFKGNIFALI